MADRISTHNSSKEEGGSGETVPVRRATTRRSTVNQPSKRRPWWMIQKLFEAAQLDTMTVMLMMKSVPTLVYTVVWRFLTSSRGALPPVILLSMYNADSVATMLGAQGYLSAVGMKTFKLPREHKLMYLKYPLSHKASLQEQSTYSL